MNQVRMNPQKMKQRRKKIEPSPQFVPGQIEGETQNHYDNIISPQISPKGNS